MVSDIHELKISGKHVELFVFFFFHINYRDEHENFCIVGVSDIDSGNNEGAKVSPHR